LHHGHPHGERRDLLNVLHHGHPHGERRPQPLPPLRIPPRSELPLLYAADGSLHRGSAATAAHGFRNIKRQQPVVEVDLGPRRHQSFAMRAVLAKTADDGTADAPPPLLAAPSSKLSRLGGKWNRVNTNLKTNEGPFRSLGTRKKQQAAESAFKQITMEALQKRKALLAGLQEALETERVPTPEFVAGGRRLPSCYSVRSVHSPPWRNPMDDYVPPSMGASASLPLIAMRSGPGNGYCDLGPVKPWME